MVGLVAIEHIYILYLEMFAWTTPRGQRAFGITPEFAQASKALAANSRSVQWVSSCRPDLGACTSDTAFGGQIQLFFLCCVIVAAIYGGITAKRSILLVQGGPALLALLVVLISS